MCIRKPFTEVIGSLCSLLVVVVVVGLMQPVACRLLSLRHYVRHGIAAWHDVDDLDLGDDLVDHVPSLLFLFLFLFLFRSAPFFFRIPFTWKNIPHGTPRRTVTTHDWQTGKGSRVKGFARERIQARIS